MHVLSEGVMRRIMPEAWDAPPGVGNTIHSVVTERSVVALRARPLGRCDETHHAGGMRRAVRRRKHHTSGAAAQCGDGA